MLFRFILVRKMWFCFLTIVEYMTLWAHYPRRIPPLYTLAPSRSYSVERQNFALHDKCCPACLVHEWRYAVRLHLELLNWVRVDHQSNANCDVSWIYARAESTSFCVHGLGVAFLRHNWIDICPNKKWSKVMKGEFQDIPDEISQQIVCRRTNSPRLIGEQINGSRRASRSIANHLYCYCARHKFWTFFSGLNLLLLSSVYMLLRLRHTTHFSERTVLNGKYGITEVNWLCVYKYM